MKEAENTLNSKGYYITNQFDGFYGTLANEYELYKNDECIMDHLSETQIIALAKILQRKRKNTMTKVEMMAKLKRNKGVGVEITTATGNMIYYFYEDFEDSNGIDRAMKQIYPQMDNGKFSKVTFIA